MRAAVAQPVASLTGASEQHLHALRRSLSRPAGFLLHVVVAAGLARAEALRRLRVWSGVEGVPDLRFFPEGAGAAAAIERFLGAGASEPPVSGAVLPDGGALLDAGGGAALSALEGARERLGDRIRGPLVLVVPAQRAAELPRLAAGLCADPPGAYAVEALAAAEPAGRQDDLRWLRRGAAPLHLAEELAARADELDAREASSSAMQEDGALAGAWLELGWELLDAAQWEVLERAAGAARRLAERAGDRGGVAGARLLEAALGLHTDRLEGIEAACGEALAICRVIGDRAGEADALEALGQLYLAMDRLEDAEQAYDAALPIYRGLGDGLGEANVLLGLAHVYEITGRHAASARAYEGARRIYGDAGHRLGEAKALEWLGELHLHGDRAADAERAFTGALSRYRAIQDRIGEAQALEALGVLSLAGRQGGAAFDRFLEGLAIHGALRSPRALGADHAYLQRAALEAGRPLRAAALGGRAAALLSAARDGFGEALALYDLARAFAALGEPRPAEAALLLAWVLASGTGHPLAEALREIAGEVCPGIDLDAADEARAADARRALDEALGRCEARLAAAGEELYAPLGADQV